jgi:hypothetical protein
LNHRQNIFYDLLEVRIFGLRVRLKNLFENSEIRELWHKLHMSKTVVVRKVGIDACRVGHKSMELFFGCAMSDSPVLQELEVAPFEVSEQDRYERW